MKLSLIAIFAALCFVSSAHAAQTLTCQSSESFYAVVFGTLNGQEVATLYTVQPNPEGVDGRQLQATLTCTPTGNKPMGNDMMTVDTECAASADINRPAYNLSVSSGGFAGIISAHLYTEGKDLGRIPCNWK